MKILSILTIYSIMVAASCKTNPKDAKQDICAQYILSIKNNWYQKVNSVYNLKEYELIWNDNLNCLIGKSKNEITNNFGEPNKNYENEIHYFLKDECLKQEGGCVEFILYLDDDNKVSSIPLPIIQPDNKE